MKAQDLLGPFVRNVEPGTIRVSNVPLLLLCIFLMCIMSRNDMWVYMRLDVSLSPPLPLPLPLALSLSRSRSLSLSIAECI